MLQSIRDRLVGWMLWVVIGAVAVPFAFWGIESFRSDGSTENVVAKVGGEKITEAMLRNAYDQRYRQMQSLMGESFRPDMIEPKSFRRRVLDDLIQETILRQQGESDGYRIPDSVLAETVRTIPAFQENGKFSVTQYRARLGEQGMSPERFEGRLRDSLAIDQLREGVVATAFATEAEATAAYRLEAQQRALSYVRFPTSHYRDAVTVGDEQVKARYEEQKTQFMAPERLKLAYVELSLDKLPKAASPGNEALKAVYEAEKATRFSTQEERQASHILINFGADKAAARKRAEEIDAKIKAGGDFAALAKSESNDTGSSKAGGSLGWIKHGQMVKAFEDALFELKKGEVSAPVESEFGWHIIRLDDLHPAVIRPLEENAVQAELLELYQKREAEKNFQDQQEQLEQLAFENPSSLDAITKAQQLPVQTTDWITHAGGAGIAANPAVIEAAFAVDLIKNNENSKPISVAPGQVVVIRKAEYEAPRQKTLEEVSAQIRSALVEEGAKAKANAEADAALKAAAAGQLLADVASAANVEFKDLGAVKRTQSEPDRAVVEALFSMPRPADNKPSLRKLALANGDVVVVALNAVTDADLAGDSAEAKADRSRLRDAHAGQEFKAYREQLRSQTKLSVNDSAVAETEEVAP